MIFCKCYQNWHKQLLELFSKLYQFWRFSCDHYCRGDRQEGHNFPRFLEHISEIFLYFFMKCLITSAMFNLKTTFKVPTLAAFWRFLIFFMQFLLVQVFNLGHVFPKNLFSCSLSALRIFHKIKSWTNNQYNADQVLVKPMYISDPSKVQF